MASIRASISLKEGLTYEGRGLKMKKGETKYLTKKADIAYFQRQSRFKVVIIGDDNKPVPRPAPPAPSAVVEPDDGEGEGTEEGDDDDDDDGEDSGPLPWRVGMKKAELIAAAESRGMAVTTSDTNPEILKMLKEHDEDQGEGED